MEIIDDNFSSGKVNLPDKWVIKSLDKIGQVIDGDRGKNYPSNDDFYSGGYCLFLNAKNVKKDGFNFDECTFVSRNKDNQLGKGKLTKLDIVLTTRGTVGNFAFYDKKVPFNNIRINSGMVIFRKESDEITYEYLYKFLQSYIIENQIRKVVFGSAQPQLTVQIINKISISYPVDMREQYTIAETLSDVDALIASLNALIGKKHAIKQGVMQELLTGKRRLPRFSGKWINKKIPEICWFQEGPGVRTNQFKNSGIKLLNGSNIQNGKINLDNTNRFISEIEAYGPYAHFMADEGDIVIASSGITIDKFEEKVAFIGREHLPLCMNTSTIRFKTKLTLLHPYFLYYLLMSTSFKEQIGAQATGSAQLNFGPAHLIKVDFSFPNMEEQIAIIEILMDVDQEINTLEQKLAKTKVLKQGMMQELLTGRIRLQGG